MTKRVDKVRGRPADTRVQVTVCSVYRCNRLTANKGGKCVKCLDWEADHAAMLVRLASRPFSETRPCR